MSILKLVTTRSLFRLFFKYLTRREKILKEKLNLLSQASKHVKVCKHGP